MGIADDMRRLTEDITASHDVRVKARGILAADTRKLAADTRKTLKGFAEDRKNDASGQAKALADFTADLTRDVDDMMKGFQKVRGEMSSEQAKALADFTANLTRDVDDMMKGFQKARAQRSEEIKEDIEACVEDIVKATRKLLGEYSSETKKARASWQGMANSLAKSRMDPAAAKVEAGEKASTVKKAAAKPKKKGGKKVKAKKR